MVPMHAFDAKLKVPLQTIETMIHDENNMSLYLIRQSLSSRLLLVLALWGWVIEGNLF
jgi:hypothetical protein